MTKDREENAQAARRGQLRLLPRETDPGRKRIGVLLTQTGEGGRRGASRKNHRSVTRRRERSSGRNQEKSTSWGELIAHQPQRVGRSGRKPELRPRPGGDFFLAAPLLRTRAGEGRTPLGICSRKKWCPAGDGPQVWKQEISRLSNSLGSVPCLFQGHRGRARHKSGGGGRVDLGFKKKKHDFSSVKERPAKPTI